VIAADRLDVNEELVRLRSHVEQFRGILAGAGPRSPVGRRLDFLLQEFGREANTIGSKGSDAPIAHQIVELKTEIEAAQQASEQVGERTLVDRSAQPRLRNLWWRRAWWPWSAQSAPMKRLREEASSRGKLVDATQGRRTRSIIVTDSDHVILSAINPETIAARLAQEDVLGGQE
jgi:regulator of extracellular matrix RemA (YlzA/DUF370 family)